MITRLKELLKEGEVTFKYTKKDGTVRTAHGTTKHDLIPQAPAQDPNDPNVNTPKKAHKQNADVQTYYDLDVKQWRSFRKDNLVEIC